MRDPDREANKPQVTAAQASACFGDVLRAAQPFALQTAAIARAFEPSQRMVSQMTSVVRAAQPFALQTAAIVRAFEPSQRMVGQMADVQQAPGAAVRSAAELAKSQSSAPPTRLGTIRRLRSSLEHAEVAQRAEARQIDEFLKRAVLTSADGTCWRCGNPTLTVNGVTCEFCAGPIAEMFQEAWSLTDPSGSH